MMLGHAFYGTWHSFGVGVCLGLLGILILLWDRRDMRRPYPRTRDRAIPTGTATGTGATGPIVPTPNGRLQVPEAHNPPRVTGVGQGSPGSAQSGRLVVALHRVPRVVPAGTRPRVPVGRVGR